MRKEMTMTVKYALIAFAALTLPAVAAAAQQPQSMAVDVGDLDLASDQGQRVLALRIERAARSVCKADAVEQLPRNLRSERQCIRETQANAARAVQTFAATRDAAQGKGG